MVHPDVMIDVMTAVSLGLNDSLSRALSAQSESRQDDGGCTHQIPFNVCTVGPWQTGRLVDLGNGLGLTPF